MEVKEVEEKSAHQRGPVVWGRGSWEGEGMEDARLEYRMVECTLVSCPKKLQMKISIRN